jgi:hypothetical protein
MFAGTMGSILPICALTTLPSFATLSVVTKPVQKNESAVLKAAIALMQARNVGMVTAEEWEKLAKAVKAESGQKIEWRTRDEILDAEDQSKE